MIAERAVGFDGYTGVIPTSAATIAAVPKRDDDLTSAFGKWHNTPEERITNKGPFDYWPTGYGFEYFYGFLAGEASQYEPTLVRNTNYVKHPETSGGNDHYHLSEDLADDAINWLRDQKAYSPDKPFFLYWAPGAAHGPHHVMKEWADKYKGKFDDGWDAYRERVFRNQKQLGWIPQDTKLTQRAESMASWESIPENEKPFQRRLMEIFAGFSEHADFNAGRIVDELESQGRLDNTLVLYIWDDNGSSSEGLYGTISEQLAQNAIPTKISQHLAALEELGGLDALGTAKTDNMYHAGWAWAGATPYQGTKLQGGYFGGTRQPMAISWPSRIKQDKTPRPQFHHVIDVVPTIYELLDITPPQVVNGFTQDPIDGNCTISMKTGVRRMIYRPSCTAGRSAFITGQLPFRTGLSKVGFPGADLGIKPEDPTLAELIKPLGYMTGQFGKNHLGDKDEMLPTNHGFDEFFGNLYHLNSEEEPENPDYPKNPDFGKKFGPGE
ncbi:Arylsulfatase [Novipirellula artificiosorum]|uniref:Arylsulfatase n=1 Tax=Novipirellula artificiosorum TaxID=2528016 RepID=A0A5C6D115_9BACT|nr:Arylsulfatase [Novipirellula artificiosorum]